ncbi:hypothetical protein SACS_0201 [Parasaccharibacter apium]|uniref:Uncharacterized protein n=1 Tax=Parasaccharibacter apium TaxID=1510841 RepID=A0A7U7G4G0_9PROT|nr:hypothetical protein SACS_0201 [Parasaccharibacter apium]
MIEDQPCSCTAGQEGQSVSSARFRVWLVGLVCIREVAPFTW